MAMPLPSQSRPLFDLPCAVRLITAAGSLTELELAWLSIACQLNARQMPPAVLEAYNTQKAMLFAVYRIAEGVAA